MNEMSTLQIKRWRGIFILQLIDYWAFKEASELARQYNAAWESYATARGEYERI
jgi:hypothetical protein